MNQWISVDEDVPDIGQQVIVARENGDVTVANYEALRTSETTVYLWIENNWTLSDILFWQPLPEHPAIIEEKKPQYDDFGFMDPDEFYLE